MQIDRESLPDFWTGRVTVGTTPVQIQAASLPLRKGLYLKIDETIAAAIVSLGKTASVLGFAIKAGQASPMLFVDDLNKLWLVSTDAGTIVTWIAF
jgi:hypothetical protein